MGSRLEGEDGGKRVTTAAEGEQAKPAVPPLCWPFPPGSQNHTEKAIKPRPYTPPKRRSLHPF